MQQPNHQRNVYLVDGLRTPFIKSQNTPGHFSASDLAVQAGRPLLGRQPFPVQAIDQVIIGCVGPSADEANIARLIALRLRCPEDVPAWTVQRNCASGLQALDCARRSIASGESDIVLAGGTEAMSRAPLLFNDEMVNWFSALMKKRNWQAKLKHFLQFRPKFLAPEVALLKGLTDVSVGMNMGQTAEELAYQFDITRAQMDTFAADSHQKALAAQTDAAFEDQLVPAYSWDGQVFGQDDGVRNDSTVERLGKLRAVFDRYGNVTAGNSSQISDGASMNILASESAVERYGLTPIARIVDCHWAALDPKIMGLGPVHAMLPLLKKHALSFDAVDVVEINEAFAAQVLACQKAINDTGFLTENFKIDTPVGTLTSEKLNPEGGAIALGHPVGASGARLALHTGSQLKRKQGRYGLASLCIGGGQGGAVLLENMG